MANVKLRQHTKVQSSAVHEVVLLCDPLCMNVSSVCVSVCPPLSEPDPVFGVPETCSVKVDSCLPRLHYGKTI